MSAITISEFSDNLSTHDVQHVTDSPIDIYKTSVGSMDNNCYFLVDKQAPQQALLIDAAANAEHLNAVAQALGIRVTTILTTHSHGDHIGALRELMELWQPHGVRHVTSALDAQAIEEQSGISADEVLDQGDCLAFGSGVALEALVCRGHTKGGVCVGLNGEVPQLFVGDCLFPGGIGGTHTPEEFQQLFSDVSSRIFDTHPDSTVVHPGHGNSTTVGAERPHLWEWKNRGW